MSPYRNTKERIASKINDSNYSKFYGDIALLITHQMGEGCFECDTQHKELESLLVANYKQSKLDVLNEVYKGKNLELFKDVAIVSTMYALFFHQKHFEGMLVTTRLTNALKDM